MQTSGQTAGDLRLYFMLWDGETSANFIQHFYVLNKYVGH
jgi:hypothetical protein